MSYKLKKILIVLIIILIVILAVLLVYNLLVRPAIEKKQKQGLLPQGQEGQFKKKGQGEKGTAPVGEIKVKAISAEPILAPTLSADKTKVIYYASKNGNIWQSDFDGSNLTKVSSANLPNLFDVIWSPDKSKVINIYQDQSENVSKSLYNFKTGSITPLSNNVQEISWSPSGDKIAYQYYNSQTGANTITISNPDGTNWKAVLNLRMRNLNVNWVKSGISFYEKPSGLVQSSLFLLDPLAKKFNKILSNIYGLSIKWSPLGDKILYSKTSKGGKGIGLFVALKDGTGETGIGIASLPEKCVWSQDDRTIFCAVPKNINSANVLPDDFYKGFFVADDEFWKINLDTGEKTPLLSPSEKIGSYDATKLFLSPLEDYLFFVNKKDGLLYSIKL